MKKSVFLGVFVLLLAFFESARGLTFILKQKERKCLYFSIS